MVQKKCTLAQSLLVFSALICTITAGIFFSFSLGLLHTRCRQSLKANHYEWGEKHSLCLEAFWYVHEHMAENQQQLTASLGYIDTLRNTHAHKQRQGMRNKHPLKCHQINENSVTELAAILETQHIQQHIHCVFFYSPAAVFLLKSTFKAMAKHFKLGWPSIVATWKDANGFIVRPWKQERRKGAGEWGDGGG